MNALTLRNALNKLTDDELAGLKVVRTAGCLGGAEDVDNVFVADMSSANGPCKLLVVGEVTFVPPTVQILG